MSERGAGLRRNITGGLHHAMPRPAPAASRVYNDVAVGIRQWPRSTQRRAASVAVTSTSTSTTATASSDLLRRPRATISLHEHRSAARLPALLALGTGDVGGDRRRAARSTWRCRPAPPTPAGCARSTRSCRRCCGSSPRRPGHPARLRLPHRGPARPPDAHRRRPAGVLPRPARPGPRGRRRAVGGVTGGGGYALVDVVPRAWTHLLAIVGGRPARPRHRDPGGVARVRRTRRWDAARRTG